MNTRTTTTRIGGLTLAVFVASTLLGGCILRSTEDYKLETRRLLETRSSQIQGCFDKALEADEKLSGDVIVNFKVEKKTGKIHDVEVDPASTAPAPLSTCVSSALDGLALEQGDMADAEATFSWTFKTG